MAVEIPVPLPGDSQQVINSLRNAALFRRVGDPEEALRWLQRAAESAGDSDDDARTLALARSVAELNGSIKAAANESPAETSGGPRRGVRPPTSLPSQPPSAKPALLASSAPRPITDATSTRPPAPSGRLNGSHPPAASGRLDGSRPPPASTREPLAARQARSVAPARASSARPKPVESAKINGAAARTPSSVPTRAVGSTLRPVAPSAKTEPATESSVALPRQAARVSVERSASEPGLYLVRLLPEGSVVQAGSTEALLVTTDPSARLFGAD